MALLDQRLGKVSDIDVEPSGVTLTGLCQGGGMHCDHHDGELFGQNVLPACQRKKYHCADVATSDTELSASHLSDLDLLYLATVSQHLADHGNKKFGSCFLV